MLHTDFINISLNGVKVKLEFINCAKTIAFLEKYPNQQVKESLLVMDANSVELELKYSTTNEALAVYNKIKYQIESFAE